MTENATCEHGKPVDHWCEKCERGEWQNLICDVCGETFNGFHKLNAAGDRCCPTCAEKP